MNYSGWYAIKQNQTKTHHYYYHFKASIINNKYYYIKNWIYSDRNSKERCKDQLC